MLAKITSAAVVGLDAVPITVEVDVASQGLPSFTKVGTAYHQFRLSLSCHWLRNLQKLDLSYPIGYNSVHYGKKRDKA